MTRPRRPQPGTIRVILEITAASLLIALVLAWVWSRVAPTVFVEVVDDGGVHRAVLHGEEAHRQFGVDGWFAVLAAGAGLLVGVGGFVRHRHRPVTVLLTLAVAGAAAACLAAWVGGHLGPGGLSARAARATVGARLAAPLELRASGLLLVWPIAAIVAALGVAALIEDRQPWRITADGAVNPTSRSEPSSLP